jgi:hypothetical protein
VRYSHLGKGQQPGTPRGASPSVKEKTDGGEVDEVDLGDAADEDDNIEEKMTAPIASPIVQLQ